MIEPVFSSELYAYQDEKAEEGGKVASSRTQINGISIHQILDGVARMVSAGSRNKKDQHRSHDIAININTHNSCRGKDLYGLIHGALLSLVNLSWFYKKERKLDFFTKIFFMSSV